MYYTDNPTMDALRYMQKQEEQLEKLPRCSECDEPIQDEYCYEINGEYICEDCLDDNHKKVVVDIVY